MKWNLNASFIQIKFHRFTYIYMHFNHEFITLKQNLNLHTLSIIYFIYHVVVFFYNKMTSKYNFNKTVSRILSNITWKHAINNNVTLGTSSDSQTGVCNIWKWWWKTFNIFFCTQTKTGWKLLIITTTKYFNNNAQ